MKIGAGVVEAIRLQAWAAAVGLAALYVVGAFPIGEIVVNYALY